jgi:hypothetical protein
MYSQQAWGGPVDPFILIKFTDVGKEQEGDPIASLVIFEWRDEDLVGLLPSPDATQVRLAYPSALYVVLKLIPGNRKSVSARRSMSRPDSATRQTSANTS